MPSTIFHITMATVTAPCPHCGHLFDDGNDAIVNACNRNKSGITRRICKGCAARVGLTYNIMSELVAFSLDEKKNMNLWSK